MVNQILPDGPVQHLELLDSHVLRMLPFVRCGGTSFFRDEAYEMTDALRSCVRGLVIAIVADVPFEPSEEMTCAIANALNSSWAAARDDLQPIVLGNLALAPPTPPAEENYRAETHTSVRRHRRDCLKKLMRSYRLFLRRLFAVGQAG
ncbi:MAG: hypothetical protein LBH53_03525 [Puniceicoccales bacterium]|nr:hypothetical protein [Puniceicoccales bacterium]